MSIVGIVQARMGSSRLPGKVLKELGNSTVIGTLLTRLSRSKTIDKIVVATSTHKQDDVLAHYVNGLGYECIRGSEEDVLARIHLAATHAGAKHIVRITADCPLIDAQVVDDVVRKHLGDENDYTSNTSPPTFPDGFDVEIVSFYALLEACENATSSNDREHVTPYIRNSNFKKGNLVNTSDLSRFRFTVDEASDLQVVRAIFEHFSPDVHMGLDAIMSFARTHSDVTQLNEGIARNEGAKMSKGQKLYRRAKRVIPGGTMLLSKRPEMHLPDGWPCYYEKTKGCSVWDLDGNEYLDMGLMGVGTNTLGYSNSEVDQAVSDVVSKGNLSSLNCPEEVELAERLVELNPWASKVRFARSGGEANAISIRIARASSGKDGVAVCGYHGWHDWYLSANISDEKNLAGHLLPGLDPNGVPSNLKDTVFPFNYNDIQALKDLIASGNIGVIKMEVFRNIPPSDCFLKDVRDLATENGIVLIFDECSSGFRETFGGLYKKYGIEPDLAVFGKTLGNGYAITAVVGREEIMEAAQSTFISSTFWTERIGPAAALETLKVMEREKSWEYITSVGSQYQQSLKDIAHKTKLEISVFGLPALSGFSVTGDQGLACKTYITQELLKSGILATTAFYPSICHGERELKRFFETLEPIFETLAFNLREGRAISDLLNGPICHSGFARLN